MAAPKNNEFWRLAKMPGKKKKFTPASLWKKAQQYFEWVEKHPLMEQKVFSDRKSRKVPKMRAMTEMAFCIYADISEETFRNYKKGKPPYEDYFEVAMRISQIIYSQKFEGAAADLLNSNIIARDLGLTDKKDITTDGESLNKGFYELVKQRRTTK
jgi:hypothetical protein